MGRASIGAKGIASALAALLLASCAGSPEAPPPRREFPGAERDAAAGGATGPSTLNAGDEIEDIDAGLFAATAAGRAQARTARHRLRQRQTQLTARAQRPDGGRTEHHGTAHPLVCGAHRLTAR